VGRASNGIVVGIGHWAIRHEGVYGECRACVVDTRAPRPLHDSGCRAVAGCGGVVSLIPGGVVKSI
jgi:hypothetical protein